MIWLLIVWVGGVGGVLDFGLLFVVVVLAVGCYYVVDLCGFLGYLLFFVLRVFVVV